MRAGRVFGLIRSSWRLELSDLDKSWHDGEHGSCLRNGVVGFGNASVIAREMPLFAV